MSSKTRLLKKGNPPPVALWRVYLEHLLNDSKQIKKKKKRGKSCPEDLRGMNYTSNNNG